MDKNNKITNSGANTANANSYPMRDRILAKMLDAVCAKIRMWRVVIRKSDGSLLEDRHEIISTLEYAHTVNPTAQRYINTMESVAVTSRWQDGLIRFLPRSIICVEDPSIVGPQVTVCAMNFDIETHPESDEYRERDFLMGLLLLRELEDKYARHTIKMLSAENAIIRMYTVDTSDGNADIKMREEPIEPKDYIEKVFPCLQHPEMKSISITWSIQNSLWLPTNISIGRDGGDGFSFLIDPPEKENEGNDESDCEDEDNYHGEDDCGDEECEDNE